MNKKWVVLIVLSLLAVLSFLHGIKASRRPQGEVPATFPNASSVSASGLAAAGTAGNNRHAPKTAYLSWGRNPFVQREIALRKIPFLQGVAWDEKKPKAVINGEILGVGGQVEGYRVTEIQKDRVLLNDGQQDLELRMGKDHKESQPDSAKLPGA